MLSEFQTRVSAPLFEIPVPGWLDRPCYERLIANVTGGRLITGPEQRFCDVDYDELGQVEWSKSKKGYCWVDALRVLDAVRHGYMETLHYGFIRYNQNWIDAIVLAPLRDVYRMLALDELEDDLLAHAATARANTSRRGGWPRGHISLHHTIEDRDLADLVRADPPGFSGAAHLQARLSYYERSLQRSGALCTVFDPATGGWEARYAGL